MLKQKKLNKNKKTFTLNLNEFVKGDNNRPRVNMDSIPFAESKITDWDGNKIAYKNIDLEVVKGLSICVTVSEKGRVFVDVHNHLNCKDSIEDVKFKKEETNLGTFETTESKVFSNKSIINVINYFDKEVA